jgi:hypothetical protein
VAGGLGSTSDQAPIDPSAAHLVHPGALRPSRALGLRSECPSLFPVLLRELKSDKRKRGLA